MSDMNMLIKGIGNKNRNIANKEENNLNKDEVLKNYNFNFDADEDTIDFLKEQTFKLHKASNNFYTELGRIFTETQEKLSKAGYGCFGEWYKSLGFKNDTVYRYISRYKLISSFAQSERQIVEKIESLPLGLSYEIAKETCPPEMREKVINGEIKNKVELVQALKSVKSEIVEEAEIEEVQEAEIVISLDKFIIGKQCILSSLEEAFEKIKKGSNVKINIEKFKKVQDILDSVE